MLPDLYIFLLGSIRYILGNLRWHDILVGLALDFLFSLNTNWMTQAKTWFVYTLILDPFSHISLK